MRRPGGAPTAPERCPSGARAAPAPPSGAQALRAILRTPRCYRPCASLADEATGAENAPARTHAPCGAVHMAGGGAVWRIRGGPGVCTTGPWHAARRPERKRIDVGAPHARQGAARCESSRRRHPQDWRRADPGARGRQKPGVFNAGRPLAAQCRKRQHTPSGPGAAVGPAATAAPSMPHGNGGRRRAATRMGDTRRPGNNHGGDSLAKYREAHHRWVVCQPRDGLPRLPSPTSWAEEGQRLPTPINFRPVLTQLPRTWPCKPHCTCRTRTRRVGHFPKQFMSHAS